MASAHGASYTARPLAPLVAHDRLLELHGAAVKAGLDREALLTGISRHFVASFHQASSVTAQILVDLGELNRVKHRVDGDLPLRIWLHNAVAMLGPRREASIVSKALSLLDVLKKL